MTIEKQHNGSYLIYTVDDQTQQLIQKVYYGYTKKEAKALFLQYLGELCAKEFINQTHNN